MHKYSHPYKQNLSIPRTDEELASQNQYTTKDGIESGMSCRQPMNADQYYRDMMAPFWGEDDIEPHMRRSHWPEDDA